MQECKYYNYSLDKCKLSSRRAETLDFRPKGRIRSIRNELVGKFKAETDFEREMACVLEGVGEERDLLEREKQRLYGDNGGAASIHCFISFWTSELWTLRSTRWELV